MDYYIKNIYGQTPLHYAIFRSKSNTNVQIIYELLRYVNPNKCLDNMNSTPLHYAARNCLLPLSVVLQLLNMTSDINAQNDNGETPLHCAIICDNTECSKILLDQPDINVEIQTTVNMTPLHLAIIHENFTVVEALLNKSANPNTSTFHSETPLHLANIIENVEIREKIINMLNVHGANNEMVDDIGLINKRRKHNPENKTELLEEVRIAQREYNVAREAVDRNHTQSAATSDEYTQKLQEIAQSAQEKLKIAQEKLKKRFNDPQNSNRLFLQQNIGV
jgi:ankyrin repeat protein